jgi:excisionase family DNA binding protein
MRVVPKDEPRVTPVRPKDDILTAAQSCRILRVTPRTLYRYIQDQGMPAFKLGQEWRLVRSDLERWRQKSSAAGSRRG